MADCVSEIENKRENALMGHFCSLSHCVPVKEAIKLSSETNPNADKVRLVFDRADLAEP